MLLENHSLKVFKLFNPYHLALDFNKLPRKFYVNSSSYRGLKLMTAKSS